MKDIKELISCIDDLKVLGFLLEDYVSFLEARVTGKESYGHDLIKRIKEKLYEIPDNEYDFSHLCYELELENLLDRLNKSDTDDLEQEFPDVDLEQKFPDVDSLDSVSSDFDTADILDNEGADGNFVPVELKDSTDLSDDTSKAEDEILFDAYVCPFMNKADYGYVFSRGTIDDKIGKAIEITSDISLDSRIHGRTIDKIISLLNCSPDLEWDGPAVSFDLCRKVFVIGKISFRVLERFDGVFKDKSFFLLDMIAKKILGDDEYPFFCKEAAKVFYNDSGIGEQIDKSIEDKSIDKDLGGAIKFSADKFFINEFTNTVFHKVTENGSCDYNFDYLIDAYITRIPGIVNILEEFYSEEYHDQENPVNRTEKLGELNDFVGLYLFSKRLFFNSLSDWYNNKEQHFAQKGDVILEPISIVDKKWIFNSPDEIKKDLEHFVVLLDASGVVSKVFCTEKPRYITVNGSMRFDEFIKEKIDYLNEFSITSFDTEGVIPIPFVSKKKTMMEIARHASMNLFVSAGITLSSGSLRHIISSVKKTAQEDPEIDVIEEYRKLLKRRISQEKFLETNVVILDLAKAQNWSDMPDNFIKALFNLRDN